MVIFAWLPTWPPIGKDISLDAVHKFRGKLERHRKSYEFKVFAEMPHGWLNDTMSGRYRQAQSEAAWAMMIDFLNRVYAHLSTWPCAVALRFENQCGLRL